MYANLAIIIIILGVAAHHYLKSTAVKAFILFMSSMLGLVAAFNFFEILGDFILGLGYGGAAVQCGAFVILFIASFALVRTVCDKLYTQEIIFGDWPDKGIRVGLAFLTGIILSGALLTAVALLPIPGNWPYERYEKDNITIEQPGSVLFKPDAVVSKLFGWMSYGGLSGEKSFKVVHPEFINKVYLNRHNLSEGVGILAGSDAVKIQSAWMPSSLTDAATGGPLSVEIKHQPIILRADFKKDAIETIGGFGEDGEFKFSMSQLFLICKDKSETKDLTGAAMLVMPVGYIKTDNIVQRKKLSDVIALNRSDFVSGAKSIDMVFNIPQNSLPILLEFKQDSAASVPKLASQEDIPEAMSFIQTANCATDTAKLNPVKSAKIYGVELSAGSYLLSEIDLNVKDVEQWNSLSKTSVGLDTQFSDEGISCTRVRLVAEEKDDTRRRQRRRSSSRTSSRSGSRRQRSRNFSHLFEVPSGYGLVSLKCNNPPTGTVYNMTEYPQLEEISGRTHQAVGVAAVAQIGSDAVYEIDYCSISSQSISGGLEFSADGTVKRGFPDAIWITEEAQTITQLYFLYLVRTNGQTIISSVGYPGEQSAGFADFEGFVVK